MLTNTLGSLNSIELSAIVGSQATNRRTTCNDRLSTCRTSSPMLRLLGTSGPALVSNERDLRPFWNQQLTEISSNLWLPTKTDYVDLDSTLLNGLSREVLEKSWFSAGLSCPQSPSSLKICLQSSMYSPAECMDLEVTKTKLVRLSPTKAQKKIFKQWTDVSRYVFNQTIDYIRSCQNFSPSWMGIKKDMKNFLPHWCDAVPFQIKGIAIKEAHGAFWAAKGRPKFRAYKDPEQSCYIPKSAIKPAGIYPNVSGKGLYFCESLPEEPMDSRLIWRFNQWWLAVPHKQNLSLPENQGKVVAIDPGVRSFISFYSSEVAGHIGSGDFSRIQRLCFHLDKLVSKRDLCKPKQKRRAMTAAIKRARAKIIHLTQELHHKAAKFLTDSFDVILLPTFETAAMASTAGRNIGKKTVRSMLTLSHFKFKQFLRWKAHCTGKNVVDCNEAYTSKTHPQTGQIRNIGGAKWIKLLDGSIANRDLVGARNIMLRALVDSPMGLKFHAVNN